MTKIALLVLYNHRYDKNIGRIERLYQGRFSHVFHLMPFYDGDKDNVIPVYASSHCFQSYIAQAYQHIKKDGFTHYFVVADDMIINPAISEKTLFSFTGIREDQCFITNLRNVVNKNDFWYYMYEAYQYNPYPKGTEISNILPPYDVAKEKLESQGFVLGDTNTFTMIKAVFSFAKRKQFRVLGKAIKAIFKSKKIKYPLIAGWSDIVLVTNDVMPQFCSYCGAFGATNLFVEIALPTALALCTNQIKIGDQLPLKYIRLLYQLPKEEQKVFYDTYDNNLSKLIEEYPKDYFYIHPIKLSQWK